MEKRLLLLHLSANILSFLLKIALLLLSVSCLTSLSSLVFAPNFGFHPSTYFKVVLKTFIGLFTIWNSTFYYAGNVYNVFPSILDKYLYSMSILFSSLLITILISFFFSYLYLFFSKKVKSIFLVLLGGLDSIPDIIMILALQLMIIKLYQKTGIRLLQLYGIGGEKVYLLPILCLSFVPIVMTMKIIIKIFEEEKEQQYVEFAVSKGLTHSVVILKHVVPNVLKSLFNHISLIYWYMLTSLFMIENLFQMQGITPLLYRVSDSSSLCSVVMIMILIPFGLLKFASFKILKGESFNGKE